MRFLSLFLVSLLTNYAWGKNFVAQITYTGHDDKVLYASYITVATNNNVFCRTPIITGKPSVSKSDAYKMPELQNRQYLIHLKNIDQVSGLCDFKKAAVIYWMAPKNSRDPIVDAYANGRSPTVHYLEDYDGKTIFQSLN